MVGEEDGGDVTGRSGKLFKLSRLPDGRVHLQEADTPNAAAPAVAGASTSLETPVGVSAGLGSTPVVSDRDTSVLFIRPGVSTNIPITSTFQTAVPPHVPFQFTAPGPRFSVRSNAPRPVTSQTDLGRQSPIYSAATGPSTTGISQQQQQTPAVSTAENSSQFPWMTGQNITNQTSSQQFIPNLYTGLPYIGQPQQTYVGQPGQPQQPYSGQPQQITVPSAYHALGNLVLGEHEHRPSEILQIGGSLSLRVPQKIKDLITTNKYVDFKTLLQNELEHNALKVEIELKDGQPTLITKPSDKREINTFEQWMEAFLIFLSIKHPEVAPVVQHAANVRLLSKTNGAWKLYDENFRYWRHQNSTWPWGQINQELWAQATAATVYQSKSVQKGGPKGFRDQPYTKKKPCFKYHYRNEFCNFRQCTFNHLCPTCAGKHRLRECPRNDEKPQRDAPNLDASTRPANVAEKKKVSTRTS